MSADFPELTPSFLAGQDILYSQFNDINFYVEDSDQENLYFDILRKHFNDIRFEKIFPLGGKLAVIENALQNVDNKNKVFIVDLDFDEILGKKVKSPNLFYLKRYSIENYLVDIEAVKTIIKEEKPKLKDDIIEHKFDLNKHLLETLSIFSDLMCYYVAIQKFDLQISNVDNDTARFCNFGTTPATLKNDQITILHNNIEAALTVVSKRSKLQTQLKYFKKFFRKLIDVLINVPGKYILSFLKYRIEHTFSLPSISLESFTYRLARNARIDGLNHLRADVENFRKDPQP